MGISEFTGMLPNLVQIEPWQSKDAYGADSYGAAKSYRARIEMRHRLIRTVQGNEAVARGRVFIATDSPPSTKDRITLPSPFLPANPPILDVRVVQDEEKIDHVVIFLG